MGFPNDDVRLGTLLIHIVKQSLDQFLCTQFCKLKYTWIVLHDDFHIRYLLIMFMIGYHRICMSY